jgi:ubiquinone/menaquinone biosynthesis C-methylase UbiE
MPKGSVRKYYDEKSLTYDDYSRQFWSQVYDAVSWAIIKPYIPENPEAVVFDAAGGTGKWTIPIAKCGPQVVLGDISRGMLKVAEEKVRREGLQRRVEIRQCDLRELDFEDETFDLVLCEHALCFIREQDMVIKELVRVLKRDCPIIVGGQNRYVMSLSLISEDVDYAYDVLTRKRSFFMRNSLNVYTISPQELKEMLENHGVQIERISGKLFTVPLCLPGEKGTTEDYARGFLDKIIEVELELSRKPDSASLGSHLQAVGFKSKKNPYPELKKKPQKREEPAQEISPTNHR